MSKYKPYPKYKESGVAWLGEVPEHWEIVQSKRLFAQRKERAKIGEEQLTASQKYGIISQKKFMELENRQVTQVIKGSEILKHIEPNDFVISMRSFQGGLEYSKQAGAVSSAYIGLIPIKHIHSNFFTYLFKSKPYIQALQSTSNLVRDGQALRFDNFSLVDLVIIPEEEQEKLADYLDQKTQKIDTLIEKQQTLIKLLKEKRQALISHAVTKGLDDTVKMKDSGVAWLGEVPEHWEEKRLKYISNINMGQSPSSKSYNADGSGIAFLQGNADFKKLNPIARTFTTEIKKVSNVGDILFTVRAPVGAMNISDKKYAIGRGLCAISSSNKSEIDFLWWLMKVLTIELNTVATGSTYVAVSVEQVSNLRLKLPPLKEQKNIAQYLDQKTNQIDTLISKSTQAIELLKERRSALISAVVTGKVDVREDY